MKNLTKKILSILAVAALVLASLPTAEAADYEKAQNNSAYNILSCYFGPPAILPGASDTVVYNGRISGGRTSAIGQSMDWYGIRFEDNAGGSANISATSGATLTLGAGGINMNKSLFSLTIGCLLATNADQQWSIADGQTFTFAGGTLTLGGNITKGTGTGAIVLSAVSTVITTTGTSAVSFAANTINQSSNAGTITFQGTKSLWLDANIGNTHNSSKVLANNLASGAVLTLGAAGKTLAISSVGTNNTLTINDVGTGVGTDTFSITTIASNITNGGTATGSLLTFTGKGTLNLTGTNTYGGNTTVSGGGTLMFDGKNTNVLSTTIISGNSTLGGEGSFAGVVRIDATATLDVDTLTFVGGLNLNNGSGTRTLNFDNNDGAKVTGGTLAWANSAANQITLNINGLFLTDWTNEPGAKTLLFDYTGGSFSGNLTSFTTLNNNTGVTPDGGSLSLFNDGNKIWLMGLTAVIPEPSTYLLLGASLLVIALLRRKKLS